MKINFKKNKKNAGFVILFAVTLAALLLSITLGVLSIAQKEILFTTSGKDANNAFFAADTGIDNVLFRDKTSANYPTPASGSKQTWGDDPNTLINIFGLGPDGLGCAHVTITKDYTNPLVLTTTVVSKGYNIGDSQCTGNNPNHTERQLQVTYTSGTNEGANVALSSNGATVAASSAYSTNYPATAAINGDRMGTGWGAGTGGWNDATADSYPDWLEVDFSGVKTISEVDVFTLQDNYGSPSTPTSTMTFTQYGLVDFKIQYWTGTAWQDITGASVMGNNLVWKQFNFSPVATSKIRVYVTAALNSYSRITEVEAY